MSGINPLALIDSIELVSVYTPPGLKYSPNAPSDPSTSDFYKGLLAKVKPKIIFHLNSGLGDQSWAPYGDPGNENYWNEIVTGGEIAGIVVAGLLGYALIDLLVPHKK